MDLLITILEGFNLPEQRHGDYEMYVKVKAGHHDEKTKKKNVEGRACYWGDTLKLRYEEGHDLKFELKDNDLIMDDKLAEGELSAALFQTRDWEGEIPLKHHGKRAGSLKVRINNPYAQRGNPGMMEPGMMQPGMGMGMGGMAPGMGMGMGGMPPGMGMGMGGMPPGMGMGMGRGMRMAAMRGAMYPPQGGMYPPQGGMYPPQGGMYPPGGMYPRY